MNEQEKRIFDTGYNKGYDAGRNYKQPHKVNMHGHHPLAWFAFSAEELGKAVQLD